MFSRLFSGRKKLENNQASSSQKSKGVLAVDMLIVGAGFSGIYALYAALQSGRSAVLVDAASGVGGTWYWNRYPGLHVDIESMEYSYGWSEELMQEWEWTERYAGQPEVEKYLNYVADKFDLRQHMHFNARVNTMVYDEVRQRWKVYCGNGREYDAHSCVMATGLLSAPKDVSFEGLDEFEGEVYKTFAWPREGVSFEGKSVGVVGTGASGVQVIPFVAREAQQLSVYQRTPSYAIPLKNHPMPREYMEEVKKNYSAWRQKERFASFGGWCAVNYKPIDQVFELAMEQSAEQRRAMYEDRWQSGCLAFYNVYPDIFYDKEANDTLAEFIREKLRERINDPELEKLLIPDYPVLMRRLCGETGYYEVFKQDNVDLVDLKAKPIQQFTKDGIIVGGEERKHDAFVFATGYDAMSGALMRLDIVGKKGKTLKDHWRGEIRTNYGLMSAGFPNMFYISGPGSPAPLFQPVLFCQDQMDWVFSVLDFMERSGAKSIEPTVKSEEDWMSECDDKFNATLFGQVDSWYNSRNVDGKPGRALIYFGGISNYRSFINNARDNLFADFNVT